KCRFLSIKLRKHALLLCYEGGTTMSNELFEAINYLGEEKGIDKDVLMETLEAALISAYKKNFKSSGNVAVTFDEEAGKMKINAQKTEVEAVEDGDDVEEQISLQEAKEMNLDYEIGDTVEIEVTPHDCGRNAAQAATQVVTKRAREAERRVIFSEYADSEEDVMTRIVERVDR